MPGSIQARLFSFERNENLRPDDQKFHRKISDDLLHKRDQLLTKISTQAYNQLLGRKRNKPKKPLKVQANYYPYTNIKLTSRKRGNTLFIRFSDILQEAPVEVLEGAAWFIISQQLNLKCPEKYREIYRDYIYSDKIRETKRIMRQKRAKKMVTGTRGKKFDLQLIFLSINETYFNEACEKPTLTWSDKPSRNRLGHFDPDLNTLVISKRLDNDKTPRYVVEYVLYHELLHGKYPGRYIDGRWCVHTKEFKKAEKEFIKLKEAKDWLKNIHN